MSFSINDKALNAKLNRLLERQSRNYSDALEKLSSGSVFTSGDPRPAERALAESLEYRSRSLSSAKRNVNDAISLIQTAEAGLAEVNNLIARMKEINISGSSTTLSDQERRFLFIEYEALHDEINRIALNTEFNGIPLLNGLDEKTPQELVFRLDDPRIEEGSDEDINVIRFEGIKSVVATTEGLGLRSARPYLAETDEEQGLTLEDVQELLLPEDTDIFPTVYDQAINELSTQRAVFGAMQARLNRSMDYLEVYQENIMAAKSKIADTDYAREVSRLVESKILTQAATAALAQGNISAQVSLNLLSHIVG